ncbi:MAG: hypothetical protein WC755_08410 [Candidatus Woesearchaeota archaeon]|jgi:hypothetical protein
MSLKEHIESFFKKTANYIEHTLTTNPATQEQITIIRAELALYLRSPEKYETITSVYHLLSTFNPLARISTKAPEGLYPAFSVAYFFCRMVDDIVDGDSELPEGFDSIYKLVDSLKIQVNGKSVEPITDIHLMLRSMMTKLVPRSGDDLIAEVHIFLDAMIADYERRTKQTALSEAELADINKNSFGPPHTIAFMALNSSTMTSQINDLMQLEGRIQAVRDLKAELPKGIINIPLEVLNLSDFSKEQLITDPNLIDNCPIIQQWIQDELIWGYRIIEELNEQMKSFDWKGRIVVKFIVGPIKKFIDKESAKYLNQKI